MQIYIAKNGQRTGPYTVEQINPLLLTGDILGSDFAWYQGLEAWQPLDTLKGIVIPELFIPPPLPTQTPPPLPKPSQSMGYTSVFDSSPPPIPERFTTELIQVPSEFNSQPLPIRDGLTTPVPQMLVTSNDKDSKTESNQDPPHSVSNSQKEGMLIIGGIYLVIFVVAIIVPLAIGTFLWNNNPTASQHFRELENVLKNITYDEVPFFEEILTENVSDDVMKKYVDYYRWFTFSFTRIKIGNNDYRFASIGFAGRVFTVGKETAESWLAKKSKLENINGEKQNNESNIRKELAGESENNAKEIIIESNKISIDDIVTIAKQKFEKYIPTIQTSRDGEVTNWKATVGDFTGDGKDDIAIEFTVTTSGTDEIKHQGIAFYRNTGDDAQVITGFDPPYQFSIEKISNGQIYIMQRLCCPVERIPKIITLEGKRVSVSAVQ